MKIVYIFRGMNLQYLVDNLTFTRHFLKNFYKKRLTIRGCLT